MNRNDIIISADNIAEQKEYSIKCRELLRQRLGRTPVACVVTFGCQQNEADSELIRSMLCDMGCTFAPKAEQADIVVFNTCAIREHAEMRAFGNMGQTLHLKNANNGAIVCVCGCMAQQSHVLDKVKKSFPYVDVLFGTHALWKFPSLLCRKLTAGKRVFDNGGEGVIIEGVEPLRKDPPNAWLSIMYGCNNFCSYCIVPYVRGRERSRDPEVIIDEFKKLIDAGYKDITLLGQNVNSYGNDLENGIDFSELLMRINSIPGDFRVRFMTSHPKDATKKLFDTIAQCDKVCKAIHLPVQCGSDRVLSLMNRRYTSEHYLSLVDYARSKMPDITITSDIIVGFPGETEADFERTIELVERVRYDSLFTFIYSKRVGTKAAEMDDPETPADKQRRFDKLLEVQNRISREKNDLYLDRVCKVLIDGYSEDDSYTYKGRTEGFKLVHINGADGLLDTWQNVKINRASTWALFGEVVD